jgi:flagellar biosynthesis/type III secretory pathway chaperone
MDANVCREHLGGLLSEEAGVLGQLEELLQREHEVLSVKDVTALEITALARQDRIGALARIEEQRRSLCTMHGHTADLMGLERLMAWCDPNGSLLSRLRECAERAGRCRELNDRNGTLVTARLKRVEGLLGVLTGRTDQAATYGPKGSNPAQQRPGRVLGAA